MTKLFAALIAASLLIWAAPWAPDDIAREAAALRATSTAAQLDLGTIVQKHIPPGARQRSVERALKEQGFELYYEVGKEDDQPREVLARRPMSRISAWFGVVEEIRLIVVFHNDVVRTATGKLIYRGS
ncbi:hypothetical protein KY495_02225 [Massilia sp. PAMC28688]|uniref:hypothetical protein n=1 Tax=Massilia sp. PAMC28688 TaxID=2861283 RepID=UPI001C63B323|nr:hypothetical protein [Massilia sp. PAMC28688]QYF94077.1 hypothetical protein KY495_02225 [Massilia sp. PAMC28688]